MNRRKFLNFSIASTLGVTGMMSTMGSLAGAKSLINMNSSIRGGGDYKALVCMYLHGGNDSFNMLIPRDNGRYQTYQNSRSNLAIAQNSLLPIVDSLQGNFGLHPSCSGMQSLYNNGNLSFISNVGTLLKPTTKTDFANGVDLPRHLFSHNSQEDATLSAIVQRSSQSGWGGRIAEILHATSNGGSVIPFNLSIHGQNKLQTGTNTSPVILRSSGMPDFDICGLDDANSPCGAAIDAALAMANNSNNEMIKGHSRIYQRSHDVSSLINQSLNSSITPDTNAYPLPPSTASGFNANRDLAEQFQMVHRLISVAQDLGHSRSIFFVELGSWDTHDDSLNSHALLLQNLSGNLNSFYQELARTGHEDQVMTFSASDFGRTLTSNGDGTDHGWGGNSLVMGSAVNMNGGQLFGQFPDLTLGGNDDGDLGRIIPTTSNDEYFATLVRWLGVSDSNMLDIFPNLINFGGASSDLGFIL